MAHATTARRATYAKNMVTGTIIGYFSFSLFDYGSTHSFISATFVIQARIGIDPLEYSLTMSTPIATIMLIEEMIEERIRTIIVAEGQFEVMLIIIDMTDFNVILGMNWLTENYTYIDCHAG